jgi:hypothetical protein
LVVFQGLVLLEVLRQIAQIRQRLDLDNRPITISMGELSGAELPANIRDVWMRKARTADGTLVLLTPACATCRLVAAGLQALIAHNGTHPIVAILEAPDESRVRDFLEETGLDAGDVVVDFDGRASAALALNVRPAAVIVRDFRITEAASVRNVDQLRNLIDTAFRPAQDSPAAQVQPAQGR